MVLTVTPRECTRSAPPWLTVVKLAVPPVEMISSPPPLTVVDMVVPPAETSSWPPLLTVVKLAVPPDTTHSITPLLTLRPLAELPYGIACALRETSQTPLEITTISPSVRAGWVNSPPGRTTT